MKARILHALVATTIAFTCANTPGAIVNFVITLDGDQEVPAVSTPASGTGIATLDTVSNLFSWNVSFSGLTAGQVAAHFHGNADLCVNAGVQIALPLGSPIIGSTFISAAQAANIQLGLFYLNVHTGAHPGGEIRGQVEPVPFFNPVPTVIPPGPVPIKLETVATGLTAPNWGISAPGIINRYRLFVTDQSGILWVIDLLTGTKSVFLDVTARLPVLGVFGPNSFDERGLLGVAFHPNYTVNGLLYTYNSEPVAGAADFSTMPVGVPANHQAVIAEWSVPLPGDPASVVDPLSRRELLRIDEPQFNHNAGAVNMDPAGLLYISLGDGGGADDKDGQDFFGGPMVGHACLGNGGNPSNPLGSVLRIDPQGINGVNGQYGIPPLNPFVGVPGFLGEIYAYGFRNPFRFSFDSATGDLYLGDVGQNDIEEIDIVTAGGHYGWNAKEGSFYFIASGNQLGYVTDRVQTAPAGVIDPIAEYDHDEGLAIIGGFVYHGSRLPALAGRYVFGEFARTFANDGRLFHLDAANQIVEFPLTGQAALGLSVLGMGQDASGEVYVLANDTGTPFGVGGVVLRIAPPCLADIAPAPGGNGAVNIDDLIALLGAFGPCPLPPAPCPADMAPPGPPAGNGVVNIDDLIALLGAFGPCP